MRKLLAILAVTTVLLSVSAELRAINKLEGYYEIEASFERRDQKWEFGPPSSDGIPRHYLELKYLSFPYTNLEAFFRLRAQSNWDDYLTTSIEWKRPPWLAAEGHLKIQRQNWETYIFYRQNRFWINDEPLLNLVDQDKVKNDNWGPQSSGIRSDFWNLRLGRTSGWGGTFIYFDEGNTFNWTDDPDLAVPNGTDGIILRLRKNFFTDRLLLGTMFLRKDWTNIGVGPEYLADSYNEVFSFDVSLYPRNFRRQGLILGPLNLENTSWIFEYAVSRDPFQIETTDIRSWENRYAWEFELRNIRLQRRLIFHTWFYDFGENFRDYMSNRFDNDRQFNRTGYHLEGILLFPIKAVTGTVSYDYYEKRIIDEEGGGLRPTSNLYAELYVEFIKGFKGKVAYTRWHGFDDAAEVFDFFTYPGLFAELSVENKLARVRIQARVRDLNTFREVSAYGFDMEFNATGKLKGYLRVLNVNEETEARATVFASVRYDLGYGAELFAEYGDPGKSDNLVNTDHFVTEGSQDRIDHRLKLFMKLYF